MKRMLGFMLVMLILLCTCFSCGAEDSTAAPNDNTVELLNESKYEKTTDRYEKAMSLLSSDQYGEAAKAFASLGS